MMEQMKKRVYTLYRVSTLGQVDKNDIPMQKQSCREFAQQNGWIIVKEFSEKGVSGYKKSANQRDAILQLRQAAVNKEFDILLVFMFDRLGRKDDETPFVVKWFAEQGIEVWSVMEGQQRFETHVDDLMNYIRYWQASGESLKTSIRTKTRLGQLTEEGYYTGGSVPFGYRIVDKGRVNKRNKPVFDLAVNEDEAAIVRLIFKKYVYEGYGSYKLCHWLHEHNITHADGKGFPNTSIQHIIQNVAYTGVVKNGEARSEIIPELQIVTPEVYEEAQRIRKERLRPHGAVPLNCKGTALLTGIIFCGHCGNRLTLTTSGGRKHTDNGTRGPARVRYECHYKKRHPGDCDGQTGYGQVKLDPIVDKFVRMKFEQIRTTPKESFISEQRAEEIRMCQETILRINKTINTKQAEIADYKAEIIKIIRGESQLTAELVNEMIAQAEDTIHKEQDRLYGEQSKIYELETTAKALEQEYAKIKSWADMYDQSSIAGKKMILAQFIKGVYVHRNYEIDIELNVSFAQLKSYARAGSSGGCNGPVADVVDF